MTHTLRDRSTLFFQALQDQICRELERLDGRRSFTTDSWDHSGGGGGRTRIITDGATFERAGVNFSAVSSVLSEKLSARLGVKSQQVFATGTSVVIHPVNPMVPTVHMNVRYLELAGGDAWFGGGMDLTPYYLYEADVRHFHQTLRAVCDRHNASYYPAFKKACDEYFYLIHRREARGVGGIFFDYQRGDLESIFRFVQDVGGCFLSAYLPIVDRRREEPWDGKSKEWQRIRRGRYVEFNLVYDRGTLFGLETEGRTESILMSLPPEASWVYNHQPEPGSREAELLEALRHPREWA